MNVLLTGSRGFIGARLLAALRAAGHSVFAFDRREHGDLSRILHLPHAAPPDAIVHAAGSSPPARPAALLADNALATARLAALATRYPTIRRFVFLSSLSALGSASGTLDEATRPADPSDYGLTKLLAEHVLADAGDGFSSLSIRLPAVLGRGVERHVVAGLAERALRGEDLRVYSPTALFNNVLDVADLVDSVLAALAGPPPGAPNHDLVNLAANEPVRFGDFAAALVESLGSRSRIVFAAPAPKPPFTVSTLRAERLYGYRPRPVLETARRYAEDLLAR